MGNPAERRTPGPILQLLPVVSSAAQGLLSPLAEGHTISLLCLCSEVHRWVRIRTVLSAMAC